MLTLIHTYDARLKATLTADEDEEPLLCDTEVSPNEKRNGDGDAEGDDEEGDEGSDSDDNSERAFEIDDDETSDFNEADMSDSDTDDSE